MNNISFVIFTRNEEKRIVYCIRNFIKYGDVLVFDDASDDSTKSVVESLGAKFITRPTKIQPDSQEMYSFVKQHVKTDWIFWGCADHILPVTLLDKMRELSTQNKFKYINLPIYTYLWGDTARPAHKGFNPRFFHKNFIDFSNNYFHGLGKFIGTKEEILTFPMRKKFAIQHYSTYDLHKFVTKHLAYAEIEAEQKFGKNKKFSMIKMLAAMVRYSWIYRRSLRGGSLGIITIFAYSFFRLMVYTKLYELENGITLESIENNYSAVKEKMLEEFK